MASCEPQIFKRTFSNANPNYIPAIQECIPKSIFQSNNSFVNQEENNKPEPQQTLNFEPVIIELPKHEKNFKTFLNNLEYCKTNPKCISVKLPLSNGFNAQTYKDKDCKKAKIHPISCKCAYCNKLSCMDLRKKEFHMTFNSFFQYGLNKQNKVSHCSFGFPRALKEDIDFKFIKNMRKSLHKVKKSLIGKNNTLRVIGVLDVSYNPEDKTFFFHWHLAVFFPSWHRGNLPYQTLNNICKKEGLKFNRFESKEQEKLFKNPVALLNYMSKRPAGILEHWTGNQDAYSKYSDWFSEQEYFNIFYREKKVFVWGYSKQEKGFIKSIFKRDFLSSIIGNNKHLYTKEEGEILPENYHKLKFFVEDLSNFKNTPPPPDSSPEPLNIEVIHLSGLSEFDKQLKESQEYAKKYLLQKRYNHYSKAIDNNLTKSDLTLSDNLNLLAFNKC